MKNNQINVMPPMYENMYMKEAKFEGPRYGGPPISHMKWSPIYLDEFKAVNNMQFCLTAL